MSASLTLLPVDILFSIFSLLRAEDILVVSQVSRVLHEFIFYQSDYLWHQLAHDPSLLLDIEPYVDRDNLPGATLQAIVTRALRVDHNWRRPNPRIKKLTRLAHVNNVCQMQFIGSHWLVVLRRSPGAASLAVWRVADSETAQSYRAAFLDITAPAIPLNFSATMQRGCREVLIAFISSTASGTLLSAYSLFLKSHKDDGFALPAPRNICSIYRPESEGRFYEVHVGQVIAVGIPQFVNRVLSSAAYRILFINPLTGVQCLIDPQLPEQFTQLHFKLYPRHLVLAGVRNQSSLVVRTHDLPAAMLNKTASSTSLVESLTTPNAEYETPNISDLDYELSADSTHNISHISAISFHSLVRRTDDYIFHFPLDNDSPSAPLFASPFSTHASASAEIVCLGETGRRAVWLERRWSSDEYTLMKATFSPNGRKPVVVEPLYDARNLALPFELHTCVHLAFEESTGRVCLALHTGELYMLQF